MNDPNLDTEDDVEEGNQQVKLLAFISLDEIETGVYRGGILITDLYGKPLEFRCTAAIHPTPIQRTLYGGTLKSHISIEITARPLIKAIREKPHIIIVHQEEFLDYRSSSEIPLLLITKQGENIIQSEDSKKNYPSQLIASASGKFSPLLVTSHWQHPEDLVTQKDELAGLFSHFDLSEPFTRISNALRIVHDKGVLSE